MRCARALTRAAPQEVLEEERKAAVLARLHTCAHRLRRASAPCDVDGVAAELSTMLACTAEALKEAYGELLEERVAAVARDVDATAAMQQSTGLLLPRLTACVMAHSLRHACAGVATAWLTRRGCVLSPFRTACHRSWRTWRPC